MERKIFDQNAYRRAYYKANPDKRLTLEERNAASLLRRLGYSITAPTAEAHATAFDAIVAERVARRKERPDNE